jgi:penicillin-binding protein 2
MKSMPTLKDVSRERRLFLNRVMFAGLTMGVLVGAVLARLFFLQIISHDHFTTLSHDNRLKILPLPPPRGLIYSRDGTLLAENRPSFSLTVVPENVTDMDSALHELSSMLNLSDDDLEQFKKQLKFARRFEGVTLKGDLTPEELATFSVNRFRFPGFSIEAGLARHYPLGDAFAHVLGYVGRISESDLASIEQSNYAATTHIGKMGVEKSREQILHGRVGYQKVEVNAQGRILRVVERTPPIPGSDIYLTLDAGLQAEAIAALENYRGAIVVLDPNSGAILAFVSKPAYDPNAFVNGISRSLYQSLSTSPDRPLFNRALQGQYPPGSTVKPLVALAGLQYGVRTPDKTTWCPGWFTLPNDPHQYRDWLRTGHGNMNLKFSIAHSCDVYYYTLAHDLGIRRLHEMLSKFGLGTLTGVDIPGEAAGLLPSPEWKKRVRKQPWYPGETLIAGIGQGYMLSTPLQLAYAAAIVATRGQAMVPHFLGQVEGAASDEGQSQDAFRRAPVELASPKYWDAAIEGMDEVVNGATGTAHKSGIGSAVRFAGKTGTAQVYGIAQGEKAKTSGVPEHLQDHALFISFAPVDAPKLAIAVVVEHGGGGSRTAAPIARRLIDYYFKGSATAKDAAPAAGSAGIGNDSHDHEHEPAQNSNPAAPSPPTVPASDAAAPSVPLENPAPEPDYD